jgi:anhydro-N-acetylmuramic acid kinase
MSGTSLDGVDVACCEFGFDRKWSYKMVHAETVVYSKDWFDKLSGLYTADPSELIRIDREFGRFLGQIAQQAMKNSGFRADLIASHGHTIFHQPEKGFTLQIGDGNSMAVIAGIPVIYDFRSADVALGGQGAPLVPVGDRLLFPDFTYCLNLGGISNISFEHDSRRIAFDVCPVNIVLNALASKLNYRYDHEGQIASSGRINQKLLDKLNQLDFYSKIPPKSLGREWIEANVFPLLVKFHEPVENLLRTFTEHIAIQLGSVLNKRPVGRILLTGGGARNIFLVERIKDHLKSGIFIPEQEIIDFKEALIFAFLGVLRWRNEINCLSSVTGATRDCCGGVIANP